MEWDFINNQNMLWSLISFFGDLNIVYFLKGLLNIKERVILSKY